MCDDLYRELAERYDWMKQKNPQREEFLRQTVARNKVETVLDCACGTGKDLLFLRSLGCTVRGSDLSDSMLAQARRNFSKANADIPLAKLDFRELDGHFDAPFDAVVCLGNAINDVHEDEEALRALRSMRTVVKDEGIVVLSQGQSDATMREPPNFAPIVNERDRSRLFVMDYAGKFMDVGVFDFIHTDAQTEFKHCSFRIRIRLHDDWQRLLREAGFRQVDFYGDWDMRPYDKRRAKRLIAVARK
jgi:SAM-dependent methyltransferase